MIPKAHIRRLSGPNSNDSYLQKFRKEGAKRGRPPSNRSSLAHEVDNDLSSPKDVDVKGPPRKELRRMISSSAEEDVHVVDCVLPSVVMWDVEEVIFCSIVRSNRVLTC